MLLTKNLKLLNKETGHVLKFLKIDHFYVYLALRDYIFCIKFDWLSNNVSDDDYT